jgi:hypothetical protein
MRARLVLIVAVAIAVLLLHDIPSVQACTKGPGEPPEVLLANSDYFVRGRVVEVDDAGQNGILRADTFYKGEMPAPEYFLFERVPSNITTAVLAGVAGDCIDLYDRVLAGQVVYAGLKRAGDGRYYVIERLYRFAQSTAQEGRNEAEEAFVAELTEVSEVDEDVEYNTSPYPLTSPLLITTEAGTQYIFPVDGGPLFRIDSEQAFDDYQVEYPPDMLGGTGCFEDGCIAYSPNGAYFTGLDSRATPFSIRIDPPVEVRGVLYSSNSNAIAIWTPTELTITTLYENGWGFSDIEHVIPLIDGVPFAPYAVWSQDGNVLAFSDSQGLWTIRPFDTSSQPSLVLRVARNGAVPYARYIANSGTYAAVTMGTDQFVTHLPTGYIYPDGLISPDETVVLAYGSGGTFQRCFLWSKSCLPDESARQLQWINNWQFALIDCDIPQQPCTFVVRGIATSSDQLQEAAERFAYDPMGQQFALLKAPTVISIGGDEYDLSDQLDGDIVEMRWLRSLFYGAQP